MKFSPNASFFSIVWRLKISFCKIVIVCRFQHKSSFISQAFSSFWTMEIKTRGNTNYVLFFVLENLRHWTATKNFHANEHQQSWRSSSNERARKFEAKSYYFLRRQSAFLHLILCVNWKNLPLFLLLFLVGALP